MSFLPPSAALDPSEAYPWILYLNPSMHHDEYALVKNAGLDGFILVLDVREAPSGPHGLPVWLHTLPALVDTRQRLAYRGASCLKKLVTIEIPAEHSRRLQKITERRRRQDIYNQPDTDV
jgi:hypothetical protein